MRADEALEESKWIKVVNNDGSVARMVAGDLIWDSGARVNTSAVWECDWEPAKCNCKVCKAKALYNYPDVVSPLSVNEAHTILMEAARCEREHN